MGSQPVVLSFLTNLAKAAFGLGTVATVARERCFSIGSGEFWMRRPVKGFNSSSLGSRSHGSLISVLSVLFHVRYEVSPCSRSPRGFTFADDFSKLGLEYDEKVLPSIGNQVLKAVVAQFNADQLLTDRPQVSPLVLDSLIKRARDAFIVRFRVLEGCRGKASGSTRSREV